MVDTSVWVNVLSPTPKKALDPSRLNEVATCLPVLQEVLQGVRHDHHYQTVREAFLSFPCIEPELSQDSFLLAADLFRAGRKRGLTIRSSVDCLISAICLKHKIGIFHQDRDFNLIARFSELKIENW
jgi:predicted nucleic acid-binding protein